MNCDRYSAHPQENEFLLTEGSPMIVIGCDEIQVEGLKDSFSKEYTNDGDDSFSRANTSFWEDLNGETLTIIYLFNAYQ